MYEFETLEELVSYLNKGNSLKSKLIKAENMSKQMMALDQVRAGGFIVGSIDSNANVNFSTSPRIHDNATDARTECKRLAVSQPGKAFIFVKLAGAELVPASQTISI